MGVDKGFDLFPPLGSNDQDIELWQRFLAEVVSSFTSDPVLVEEVDGLTFKVGEHPFLNRDAPSFRRFSSKVSGGCHAAEQYIREVQVIARKYFGRRIHPWSEYGYEGEPFPVYSWNEVYAAPEIYTEPTATMPRIPRLVPFADVCKWVLRGWEANHVGMNGLRFVSASFQAGEGYSVVQEQSGSIIRNLTSIDEWSDDPDSVITKKAYWATRAQNNCKTLNVALMNMLNSLQCRNISKVSVEIDNKTVHVQVGNCRTSLHTIGLTPHFIGTITEPCGTTMVPPSPDGETFHTFVVGKTIPEGIPIALDCSTAQFGVFGPNDDPFLALPLAPYLRRVAKKHRMLSQEENLQVSNEFVAGKASQVHSAAQKIAIGELIAMGLIDQNGQPPLLY